MYNKTLRAGKSMYYSQKLAENQGKPKGVWKILNESLNRVSTKNNKINEVKVNNHSISDSHEIANSFNIFFSEIAGNIQKDIPPTTSKPEAYISDTNTEFYLSNCSPENIKDIILSLETKNSLDIEDLSTKVLKKVADSIASPLCYIINLSLELGYYPERLKVSRTVPIFKSGQPDDLSNYRPISCLPVISKIFEKVVSKQLFNYLETNNLLYSLHFGFQPFKSTVHPLIHMVHYISKAFNRNEFVIAVFLDLKKAFDLVDHKILLMKLRKIGIGDIALKWFETYLENRKQFVMVDGALSDFATTINISVLQGSILGPLLFLIFINDFHKSNNLLNLHFADDTSALCKGNNLVELSNFMNLELQKIGTWLRANKLAINASKTKIMIFHPKGKIIPDLRFVFNDNDLDGIINPDLIHPLERIHKNSKPHPAFKILGVYFDENLSFDYHSQVVSNKISKSMYSLNKVKKILPTSALISIYYAIIHPHLLYCLPNVSCTSQTNMNSLFIKQKRCIRFIGNAKYNAHTEPLFLSLKILPLPELIAQQCLYFMHSIEYNYAPFSFFNPETFPRNLNLENHSYPLRNLQQFNVSRLNSSWLKRFPLYTFTTAWNELDISLKSISSKIEFKIKLKKYLLGKLEGFVCTRLFCYSCSYDGRVGN